MVSRLVFFLFALPKQLGESKEEENQAKSKA